MAGIDTAHLIYLIVLLAMVAGWFFMHSRPNMNKTLQQAAVWGLIFTGAAAGVGLWQDITRDSARQHLTISEEGDIVLPRGRDGHYYLTAQINGAPRRASASTPRGWITLAARAPPMAKRAPPSCVSTRWWWAMRSITTSPR